MAAALLEHRLSRRRGGLVVRSAGLNALVGERAELHALALMGERGMKSAGTGLAS